MVQFFNDIWIPDSPTIWILDKWTEAILFSCILVQYLNGGWSSTKDIPHKPTIWDPNFKKLGIQMFPVCKWSVFRSPLYDKNVVLRLVSGVQMVGIQISCCLPLKSSLAYFPDTGTLWTSLPPCCPPSKPEPNATINGSSELKEPSMPRTMIVSSFLNWKNFLKRPMRESIRPPISLRLWHWP